VGGNAITIPVATLQMRLEGLFSPKNSLKAIVSEYFEKRTCEDCKAGRWSWLPIYVPKLQNPLMLPPLQWPIRKRRDKGKGKNSGGESGDKPPPRSGHAR
jgi:hypothetical protein